MVFYYLQKINADGEIIYVLLRAFIVFIYAIFLIRVGSTRYNFDTPLDFVLVIIIGAVLARSINGQSTLAQAMAGSAFLVFIHWLFTVISFHYTWFGKLVKGRPVVILKNGKLLFDVLRKYHITDEDMKEALRQNYNCEDFDEMKEARLERTGCVTFIRKTER